MECLAITARLYSGFVASDQWSPAIDGIIAYWQLKERLGDEFNYLQARVLETVNDLPLQKITHGDLWWYACSSPIYRIDAKVQRHVHRRFDQQMGEKYLPDNAKSVQVKSGAYKNARMIVQHIVTNAVTWHVIGNRNEIERLLNNCYHIGAHYGIGFGRVREWEYSAGDEQMALLRRPLPSEYALKHDVTGAMLDWGIRPPARIPENIIQCVMPTV